MSLISVTSRWTPAVLWEWDMGKEKVSVIDPVGFGFYSSVNYLDDPCTQMNSPGVKQAISLPLMKKSKMMLSLYLRSCSFFRDNMRPSCWTGINEEKEWLNEWTDEIKTVMTNRVALSAQRESYPSGSRDDYLGKKARNTMKHLCKLGPTFSGNPAGMSLINYSLC